MRIIKPYGRSQTTYDGSHTNRRVLRLRPPSRESRDIAPFAETHDELVIAQWISSIDKIATKPSGKNGATAEQRALRERLGDAAWAHLRAKELLSGLTDPDRETRLEKLWKVKIAPYGSAEYKPRYKRGREVKSPSPKGRWYQRFAGDVDVAHVDAGAVVAKIHEHLYEAEYRIDPDVPKRGQGKIAARARSIAGNVLQATAPAGRANSPSGWSREDEEVYGGGGDVALEIRQAVDRRERGEDRDRPRRATRDIAGKALFDQYGRLFLGENGKPLTIEQAKDRFPELLNLHMAVKDCYARILKHHKKDQRSHGDNRRKVSTLLPGTMEALFALVGKKTDNRDLNALVRLGRVIHYEASGSDPDHPADVVHDWPADVTHSRHWTSDGQAEIKRNEAFVRVWRHVLALANRTLKDWADPDGDIDGDILLSRQIDKAVGGVFDSGRTCGKLDLLFGDRAELFKGNGNADLQKGVLNLALKGTARLRHGSFHFKGLGGFTKALDASCLSIDRDVRAEIDNLWECDIKGRAERLRDTMRGHHFGYFLDEDRNRKLFEALSDPDVAEIPLPRFRRILERVKNAWSEGKDNLRLPEPANRNDLESHPARLCQYTALKLVYDRPFRTWLSARGTETLNGYIDQAVHRATNAARAINAKNDEERREVIVAKAAGLGRLAERDDVRKFFFNLSAATASEMRVQRGYESDAGNARKQAEYIENLKCDVLALAFADYLSEAEFDFLLTLSEDSKKPAEPLLDLDHLRLPAAVASREDWQPILYFLVHLVPVDEIGKLLHQMRKWEILAGGSKPAEHGQEDRAGPMTERARKIQRVLELYLDMHDAKFEGGGTALIGIDDFKKLFEPAELFSRVFPEQPNANDEGRVPRRGLREIMRFGHLAALSSVFENHRIKTDDVDAVERAEQKGTDNKSEIATCQETRERLHEKWSQDKDKKLDARDLRDYANALKAVVTHRHLAAHTTLTDHARLHRLLMAVLGRLVDFSGLWERDLYFVTLALIHQAGQTPADVFTCGGIAKLEEGQIADALRALKKTGAAPEISNSIRHHFGSLEKGKPPTSLRNDFAHFNMLHPGRLPVDLTACVNDARRLMAYDRKLKNAVAQSVKELLHREGLELEWTMGKDHPHQLRSAVVTTRQAPHLGKEKLFERQARAGRQRPRYHYINENLHGRAFVGMVASLFGGEAGDKPSIAELDLDAINWEGSRSPKRPRKEQNHVDKPRDGASTPRNRRRKPRKPPRN